MKKLTLFLIIFLSIALSSKSLISASVDYTGLGDYSHYNAIILNDCIAEYGNVEGSIAIQGDLVAPSSNDFNFIIASAASNDGVIEMIGFPRTSQNESHPSLIVGGSVSTSGSALLIVQSTSTGSAAIITPADDSGLLTVTGQTIIPTSQDTLSSFFTSINVFLNESIDRVKELQRSHSITDAEFGIGPSASDSNVLISSINIPDTFHVQQVNIPNVGDNLLIIYCEATTIDFANGSIMYDIDNNNSYTYSLSSSGQGFPSDTLTQVAQNMVWVFPEATVINSNQYDIIGTVIAPKAIYTGNGGSVNGQLFVNNLSQQMGFRINNFPLNWTKFNTFETSIPVPPTEAPTEEEDDPFELDDPDPFPNDDYVGLDVVELESTLQEATEAVIPTSTTNIVNSQIIPAAIKIDSTQSLSKLNFSTTSVLVKDSFSPPISSTKHYIWSDINLNNIVDERELDPLEQLVESNDICVVWGDLNSNNLIDNGELIIQKYDLPLNGVVLPQTGEISNYLYILIGLLLVAFGFYLKMKPIR